LTFTVSKREQILAGICVFVLAGILTAGLWPFHAPANQVAWLRDGLLLGRHGTVLSTEVFKPSTRLEEAGRSVEIWLQPAHAECSRTILAFYNPAELQQFSLHQSDNDLALQTDLKSTTGPEDSARLGYLGHVFRQRSRVFVTITSGSQGTAAYVDGSLAERFPSFRPGSQAFTGRLVLGNSPVVNDSWSGIWLGLAIYNQELTAAQVRHHYESWTAEGRPDIRDDEQSTAVYLFDERRGNIVHNIARNRSNAGIALQIPEKYQILNEKFLEPAWKEFRSDSGYWKNLAINIVGFIPLGFFFYAYWSSARHRRWSGLLTVMLGAATSLTIEVLQAFLPTRDSGTTDLITNTLGTYLGVMFYRWTSTLLTPALDRLPLSERLPARGSLRRASRSLLETPPEMQPPPAAGSVQVSEASLGQFTVPLQPLARSPRTRRRLC
jgi:VanZ family protein